MNTLKLSVFDYTDYRRYLADFYALNKKNDPSFSYRYFARLAGFSSSGFYKELIDGKRSLSRTLIIKFSKALKLKKRESEYFEYMVYFSEARTLEEKNLYFGKMMDTYESKASLIHADYYEYFSRWYYAAVRELLQMGVEADPNVLAARLSPSIRPDQAAKALTILEKLHFIRRDERGAVIVQDPLVTARAGVDDPAVQVLNLITFQKEMHRLADEAYDRHPLSSLDMSTLTLSVSHETFAAIKEELASLRKKILTMARHDQAPDRIYQLNQHLFPLTKVSASRGRGSP